MGELREDASWLGLTLRDCLDYDPASGTMEECWERMHGTTDESAWSAASYRVARVDARGVAIPAVIDGRNTTGDLVDFAVGDRGERYVVTAFDPATGLRFCYGWADDPGRLLVAIMRARRFWGARIKDREREAVEASNP